ncbi:uncharacterized protein LOC126681393 [Mercurialis annua]|uniref:uncharacterized protein LOC126681393 n=1 Tax=Mercurialis annua TaxID=3986 RepID=UPI0024AF5DDA|nr:uncharacterized protein LOC126681393 [Mercurialis annua]
MDNKLISSKGCGTSYNCLTCHLLCIVQLIFSDSCLQYWFIIIADEISNSSEQFILLNTVFNIAKAVDFWRNPANHSFTVYVRIIRNNYLLTHLQWKLSNLCIVIMPRCKSSNPCSTSSNKENSFHMGYTRRESSLETDHEQHFCTDNVYIFVRGINQFLEFFKGKKISSFKLCYCLVHSVTDDMNRWVRFAVQMGAETLYLGLQCKKHRRLHVSKTAQVKYVLEKDIFGGGRQNNVKHLHLVDCCIGKSISQQFSYLETLVMDRSPLALYDLQSVFSCLLNLRTLMFVKCDLPVMLCFASLLDLRDLRFMGCSGIKGIKLSNARLDGLVCIDCKSLILDFSGAPVLSNLVYFSNNHVQILQIASQICELSNMTPS